MANVVLNLRDLNIGEKVALSRRILAAMSDNPRFPAPDPPLVLLARLADELEGQEESPLLAKNEFLLGETLSRLATYVQNVSGGSDSIITSAGMKADSHFSSHDSLPKPANFSVAPSKTPTELSVRCDPVPGAKTYVFQSTPDPLTNDSVWNIGSVSTGPVGTIYCMTEGQRLWFRASAVGSSGQGPWSDPVSEICH